MKTNAYVIFDTKAKLYNKPFYFVNDQVALRSAHDVLYDEKSEIANSPEDFIMFKIGTYCDESAVLDQHTPEVLCKFHELQPKNAVIGDELLNAATLSEIVAAVASELNLDNEELKS